MALRMLLVSSLLLSLCSWVTCSDHAFAQENDAAVPGPPDEPSAPKAKEDSAKENSPTKAYEEDAPSKPGVARVPQHPTPAPLAQPAPLPMGCTSGGCGTMSCTACAANCRPRSFTSKPGVARCTAGCPTPSCTARRGSGCTATGCGPNGCTACRSQARSRAKPDLFTFHDLRNTVCAPAVATGNAIANADHRAGQWSAECDAFQWAGQYSEWADETHTIGPFGSMADRADSMKCQGRKCDSWCNRQCDQFLARNRANSEILHAHWKGKFAYFIPMGNGGEGVPPFGFYHMVYAADPNYSDPRDSGVYAAQGYGVPISVPLPPTVRHTMNYSAGIPASRLTPISNVVPPQRGY